MKRTMLVLICATVAVILAGKAIPKQLAQKPKDPTKDMVITLRLLNTEQANYWETNHRFADRDQIVSFLRQDRCLKNSPIDLENPKLYGLTVITSADGLHYQIALGPNFDPKDESTWCKTVAFTTDQGVIYLGKALGCDASANY
jgi:hypothetical protein